MDSVFKYEFDERGYKAPPPDLQMLKIVFGYPAILPNRNLPILKQRTRPGLANTAANRTIRTDRA